MAWWDDLTSTVGGWFSGEPSYTQFDPTLGGAQIDTGLMNVLTPQAATDWYMSPTMDFSYQDQTPTSSFDWGSAAKLGLGGLGMLGNLYEQQRNRRLQEEAMDVAREKTEAEMALARERQAMEAQKLGLGSADDFAKMHALAQIIQARQGINLDPSLAYAQAMREQQGLSPASATEFAGVDVGGPLQVGMTTADRQAAINRALGLGDVNLTFAGGGMYRGGGMHMMPDGTMMSDSMMMRGDMMGMMPMQGGLSNYARGGMGGQEDTVNARLSDGEYVMDADVVAALGDGNSEAGARKLDEMRMNIRKHKRSMSPDKIPPKAKGALSYMTKGK